MENKIEDPADAGTVTIRAITFDKQGLPNIDFDYDDKFVAYLKKLYKKDRVSPKEISTYVMNSFMQTVIQQNKDMINKKQSPSVPVGNGFCASDEEIKQATEEFAAIKKSSDV